MDGVDNILNDIIQDTLPLNNIKVRKKRCYTERKCEEGHERIWNDYFSSNPVHNARQFRRRFRLIKELFLRIVNALKNHSDYVTQRFYALGRSSLSPLQKCVDAIRLLAYGVVGDAVNEYVCIGGNTAIQCLKKLCKCVIEIFEPEYLRRPTMDDIQPWQGQYTGGHQGVPTRVLEVVASSDLWIWHAYFGVAGSNNDVNVLD
ncbi:uncharacterized protein LOC130590439 [Beta vulgaris subsp. vulgaris]|uniref:uncharacterized protein LOC130590439 n=1 Tax=Beta vulgaris subsp. vulgaris TaxID=3555 RepID=UPI0025476425|nr:uncharacterized protein LOC130590439 [Beta vulgaris subsp. vulgaris]